MESEVPVPATTVPATATTTLSKKLFSKQSKYEVPIPHPDFDNDKLAKVRWPTDEEWCRRARTSLRTQRSIGRDATQTEMKGLQEASLEIFDVIRTDANDENKVPFDQYEANTVLNRIGFCQVRECVRNGNRFRVTLDLVGGLTVVHTIKVMSQKMVDEFIKSSEHQVQRRNLVETRNLLEPSGELWDKLVTEIEGYALTDGQDYKQVVPIIHKDIAITEVFIRTQQSITEGPDPQS